MHSHNRLTHICSHRNGSVQPVGHRIQQMHVFVVDVVSLRHNDRLIYNEQLEKAVCIKYGSPLHIFLIS